MSNLKLKIAYEGDIRIFKTTSNTTELLNKIISFVKETHKIETFRLVYKDEEEDEITIADNNDLNEALNSNNRNKTTKIYVKKINKEILESDSTSDETSLEEEEIELQYYGTNGWGVMRELGHHRRHHGHHGGHKHHKHDHDRHHHHKHHHRHHHSHHGHHEFRKFGKRDNMHKHCAFNNLEKDEDLRVEIIDENVSLAQNAFVNPGEYLIKTWKLKNVGKKRIPSNSSIEYRGRRFNLMIDSSKFELKNKEININEEFEVSISVKSPIQNGKYRSKWRLITPDGKKFGQPLFVSFIVNDNNNNDNNNKILKKQEKLRCKKEKLLEKLQLLQEQSNELNNNNDKDDVKEEIEGNETQNNIDNINLNENKIIIDDITIEDDEDTFIYGVQLQQLKNMGFNNENKLKNLLKSNNGSIEAVLNNIF